MQNSIVMLTFASDRYDRFWANLVQKIKMLFEAKNSYLD